MGSYLHSNSSVHQCRPLVRTSILSRLCRGSFLVRYPFSAFPPLLPPGNNLLTKEPLTAPAPSTTSPAGTRAPSFACAPPCSSRVRSSRVPFQAFSRPASWAAWTVRWAWPPGDGSLLSRGLGPSPLLSLSTLSCLISLAPAALSGSLE